MRSERIAHAIAIDPDQSEPLAGRCTSHDWRYSGACPRLAWRLLSSDRPSQMGPFVFRNRDSAAVSMEQYRLPCFRLGGTATRFRRRLSPNTTTRRGPLIRALCDGNQRKRKEVLTNQAQMIDAKVLVPEDVVTYACRAFAIGRCDRGFCVAEFLRRRQTQRQWAFSSGADIAKPTVETSG